MNAFSLQNKVAIVTGGASGIGRAISLKFAENGAIVHVLELNPDSGTNMLEIAKNLIGEIDIHACNVANTEEVDRIIAGIVEGTGRLDILVNNAGIAHIGNIEETSPEDLDKLYQVNIKGVYNCAKASVNAMKKNGGVILNMASIASHVGISNRFAYSMSKGAVLTMTYSIAKDYIEAGIRCNCISPARVHTPFVDGYLSDNYPGKEEEMYETLSKTQPIGRMGKPEEIANLALYLCSDEASFITGTDYPIDGGYIKLNG